MLEPRYTITQRLLKNIKEISRLTTELKSRHFPDIVLYEIEETSRELSVFSSTGIEGNPLPLTEVKQLLKKRPRNLRDSEREVINYNSALKEIYKALKEPSFSMNIDFICSVQKIVASGLIAQYRAGALRKEPVFVNDPRTGTPVYLPPDHGDVQALMEELVAFVSGNKEAVDPIIVAGIFHKQFVIIHPFIDGNGRTVRLCTSALLARAGFDTLKLFSFENYYNRNVSKYFQMAGAVGNYYDIVGDIYFTPWLEFFSEGIIDELMRVKKELETRSASPDTELKSHEEKILAYIQEYGYITDKNYAGITNRAKATRSLDFKRLIELGYITREGKGKNTYYRLA